MPKDFDVIVVGELNCDLILCGDVMPVFGQVEKLVGEATLTIGSSSAIFACGAARLGLRVAFAGKVGDDEFGHFMLRELAARGIETSGIIVDPLVKTGLTVILSQGNDRAMLTFAGSIATFRAADIKANLLPRARHLHLGSYFLQTALRPDVPRLFAEARAHGLTVSLDTNYDPAEKWAGLAEVWPHVDVFLPNEAELLALTQRREVEGALAVMSERVPVVAVKLGARGSMARRGALTATAGIVPVSVVDTTGAGDSFDAGFVYGHLAGWDLERALRFAGVCGSLSTRAAGGTGAQATLAEALVYL
jgi:sugar/nucleoside kinase (ribokinase family)